MLRQRPGTVYGGSELRAWRIARGLAESGFAVSLTNLDRDDPPAEVVGPVAIIGERKLSGRWSALFRRSTERRKFEVWERANADVYVIFGVAEYSAVLADWCQVRGRPLVLAAGSDLDFAAEYRSGNLDRNAYGSRCDLCHDAIVKATEIVVQTDVQRRLAHERFGRAVRVIANPIDLLSEPLPASTTRHVIWVGKSDRVKRPEIAVAVARLCPEILFRLIVNRVDGKLFDWLQAEAPPNVSVLESVRPSEMQQHYTGAFALLNTSLFEGFPNAILEAGSFGVPLLSLSVDPGEIIKRERGGAIADGDVGALATLVQQYHDEPEFSQAAGRRLQDYVRRTHEASARIADFAALMLDVAKRREQRTRGIG